MDMAGANHTGINHHGNGSRTNSLEPPVYDEEMDHHYRGLRDDEGQERVVGALFAAEQRRQRSIRNKKVNWKMAQQYGKLGSEESSQGGGGSGVLVNGEEPVSELELLLIEPSQDHRDDDHQYYDYENNQYHHHRHLHRQPSYLLSTPEHLCTSLLNPLPQGVGSIQKLKEFIFGLPPRA